MKRVALCLLWLSLCLAQRVRLEAENGHVIGSTQFQRFGSTVSLVEENDKIIFTCNIPVDDSYPVTLQYSTSAQTAFHISANGYEPISFNLYPHQFSHTLDLVLREGINTIIVQKTTAVGSVSLDYIEILGAIHLSARGATLNYVEYEAENAKHNGNVIGPDRTYLTLPSEASGRRAVNLNQGQQINFTLTASANAIVVRFSIPDSSDGHGQNGSLGVSVNGQQVLTLPVTSKWSWTYGSYPFTNNPGDGQGHHFYDDTRGIFPNTLASGTTVTITPLTGLTYTIDLADFYNIPQPYSQPSNSLDITTYGADASGKADSTAAIQKAITDGTNQGKVVWIPKGTFLVNTIIYSVNKVTIRGAGPWYSSVVATVTHGVGFFGNWAPNPSTDVNLYDFAVFGATEYRDDNAADSATGGATTRAIVQNLWIEHTKCGMWLDGPFDSYHVTGVTIRNTWADGINYHKGVTNSIVEQSIIRNTGDDGLATWPDSTTSSNIVYKFNTVGIPILANGIAIYGGTDMSITDNDIADTICEGGAIQVANRFNSVPLAGTTIVARNTAIRCGAPNRYNSNHNGAYWWWSEQAPMTNLINVTDLQISDSSYAGFTFWGTTINNIHFTNVNFTGGPYAVEVNSLTGVSTYTNTVATGLTSGGIYSCDPGFQIQQGSGCSGWSDTHC